MRVAAVVVHAAPGGPSAERRLVSGALALGAAGVSVDVFSNHPKVGSPGPLGEGVALRPLVPRLLQRDLAKDGAYDVVHAFSLSAMRLVATLRTGPHRIFTPYADRWSQPAS